MKVLKQEYCQLEVHIEVKDWGESVSELMIVKKKITKNCTQYCLALVFLPFVHVVF